MAKKKVSRIPEWQAEDDFYTLTRAEEIRANKARTQRAVAAGNLGFHIVYWLIWWLI